MLGVAYIRFGITGQLCYNVYEIKFFINKKRRNAYVDKEMIKNIFLQTDVMITEKFAADDFGIVLLRYMGDRNINSDELAEFISVDKSTIFRDRRNEIKPSLKCLMKICIALRLYKERSDYLFELRGIILGHNRTHLLYKAILADVFLSSRSISDYNEFLRKNGVDEKDLL